MPQKAAYWYDQSAVIPYRRHHETAVLEVLLVTSRRRTRWVIPKGIIEPELTAQTSAVKEAFEEAGIRGNISEQPIGFYLYHKWKGVCRVEVFLLEVTDVFETWPEADERDREWMNVAEAARRVREEDLKALLRKLPEF